MYYPHWKQAAWTGGPSSGTQKADISLEYRTLQGCCHLVPSAGTAVVGSAPGAHAWGLPTMQSCWCPRPAPGLERPSPCCQVHSSNTNVAWAHRLLNIPKTLLIPPTNICYVKGCNLSSQDAVWQLILVDLWQVSKWLNQHKYTVLIILCCTVSIIFILHFLLVQFLTSQSSKSRQNLKHHFHILTLY